MEVSMREKSSLVFYIELKNNWGKELYVEIQGIKKSRNLQYNSIGLISTQYRCGCIRSHAGHVIKTRSSQFVSRLQTVEVQGCLFRKCNECSLSNTTWYLVLT
jgi:hypothetical protein